MPSAKIEQNRMPSMTDTDLVPELERILVVHAREFAAKGVRSISVIGSHARGTAKRESDIDLLLDLAPDATFGLIELVQLNDTLGDTLRRKVDIAFEGGHRPYVEARMTRDARQVLLFYDCDQDRCVHFNLKVLAPIVRQYSRQKFFLFDL
jgi:predicted nucleotidyltransferase